MNIILNTQPNNLSRLQLASSRQFLLVSKSKSAGTARDSSTIKFASVSSTTLSPKS